MAINDRNQNQNQNMQDSASKMPGAPKQGNDLGQSEKGRTNESTSKPSSSDNIR